MPGATAGPTLRGTVAAAKVWRVADARGQVVGRLASAIASTLLGKHKPGAARNRFDGDPVVVINADHVGFTGNKWRQKMYYNHSQHPGGLRERAARDVPAEEIITKAVSGMLPKNRLRRERLRNLRFSKSPEDLPSHSFVPLVPVSGKRVGTA